MSESSEKVSHDAIMAMGEQINELRAELARARDQARFAEALAEEKRVEVENLRAIVRAAAEIGKGMK